MDIHEILTSLRNGAQANREDPCRHGNVISLEGPGKVIMTGDLHAHERNYEKLVHFAELENNPDTHLIVQEIIHGNEPECPDQCHSYRMMAKIADLKCWYPRQVHILMGNHEMSQVSREEILKNGQPMVRALNTGLYSEFGEQSSKVMQAIDEFILSLPLAAQTDTGVWMSHSIPAKSHMRNFDDFIFEKILTIEDMTQNRSLYALLWDRRQTEEAVEELAQMWDVEVFLVGHQPQPTGYCRQTRRMIILSSEHNHGCFLPFDLGVRYDGDQMEALIRPIASLV